MLRKGSRVAVPSLTGVLFLALTGALHAAQSAPQATSPSELPGWREDDQSKALPAFLKTCDWAREQHSGWLGDRKEAGRLADWRRVCGTARTLPTNDASAVRLFFETNFQVVTLTTKGDGQLSAYHTPLINGSWKRSSRFSTPIYRMPEGGRSLPGRAAIAGGALTGEGLELLWVDDPVAAYFMEVEGSGRVRMTDGSIVDLDFAGQNGKPYRDLAQAVAEAGYIDEDDERSLTRWMRANPNAAERAMNLNPSKVFFKLREGGVRGSLGLELTPGRSVAVDPRHTPLGPPIWLDAADHSIPIPGGGHRRLVVAQDIGGDVKGRGRADIYVGHGKSAERAANRLSSSVKMAMLVPRSKPVQVAEGRASKR